MVNFSESVFPTDRRPEAVALFPQSNKPRFSFSAPIPQHNTVPGIGSCIDLNLASTVWALKRKITITLDPQVEVSMVVTDSGQQQWNL